MDVTTNLNASLGNVRIVVHKLTKKPIAELMAEVKTVMMETKSGECRSNFII